MPGSNRQGGRHCNNSPSPTLLAQCHLPGTDRSAAEGRLMINPAAGLKSQLLSRHFRHKGVSRTGSVLSRIRSLLLLLLVAALETQGSWCGLSTQESLRYQSSRPCPASHSLSPLEAMWGDAEWMRISQWCPCWEGGRKEGIRTKRSCTPLRTAQIAQFCSSWIHRYRNAADQLLQEPHAPDLFRI